MQFIRISKDLPIPLIGLIHIGIIDRGSTLLQVRPTTICNLKCPFCSTSANDPNIHQTEYEVEPDYLIYWIKEAIKLKGNQVTEINIDSVGESLTHPRITDIISKIKKIPQISFVSMQSNGMLLASEKIKELEQTCLDRLNLSIHTLDSDQAKFLAGTPNYNLDKVLDTAKQLANSKIELIITPVLIPNINDNQIPNLISLAKQLNCKIAIQKYETYRYSRKLKGAKRITWYTFYKLLEKWEKQYNIKLKYGPLDFNIRRSKRIPYTFEINKNLAATIIAPGWLRDEMIAVANNRAITILNCKNKNPGDKIKIKIIENKNNIYLAKQV